MKHAIATILLVLIGVTAASADVVYMRDGSKREGRVVEQTDDKVVLEIAVGSNKARVTISRADIARIEEKLTDHEKLQTEYQKRLKAVDRADADAVIEMGKWCISKKLYTEAEGLYKDLAGRGDAQFAKAQLALANMEYDRGRLVNAKGYLQALLDKNPKDLDAKLLWDRISDDEKASAQKYLTDAVDLAAKGKAEAALAKLEAFHDRVSEAYAKAALEKVKLPGGMKFEEFVADQTLKVPCPSCKLGMKTCPTCKGKVNDDAGLCRMCGGALGVVCDKCGGTGVKLGDVDEWKAPALVRAMETRASAEAAEFQATAKVLAGAPAKEQLPGLALKAQLAEARAAAWLGAIDAAAGKGSNLTMRDVRGERDALEKQWRDLCAKLGDAFDAQGRDAWAKVEASETGPLSQDRAVRGIRDDLVRAAAFYDRTRAKDKDPYPVAVGPKVDALGPLVDKIDTTLERNAKILKAFDAAMKQVYAKRAQPALDILVEIVKVSSKTDLVYLSQLTSQKTNATLPEAIAALRFEVGREKGEFGETTEYERPAFMKLLIGKADGMAGEAQNGYDNMKGYSGAGKRNSCPTTVVRNTREKADNARKWYKAALVVPYPLSADKRQQIMDSIQNMDSIIYHCNHWYVGGGSGVGGTGINMGG